MTVTTFPFLFPVEQKKSPKATIPLFKLKAVFVPEKIGNPNGLQLTYKDTDNATRNIYVYSDSGKVLFPISMSVSFLRSV